MAGVGASLVGGDMATSTRSTLQASARNSGGQVLGYLHQRITLPLPLPASFPSLTEVRAVSFGVREQAGALRRCVDAVWFALARLVTSCSRHIKQLNQLVS
jgi:hypothetical protein